jgi:hypothetical protein
MAGMRRPADLEGDRRYVRDAADGMPVADPGPACSIPSALRQMMQGKGIERKVLQTMTDPTLPVGDPNARMLFSDLDSDASASAYFQMRDRLTEYSPYTSKRSLKDKRDASPLLVEAIDRFLSLPAEERENCHLCFSFGLEEGQIREMKGPGTRNALQQACRFFSVDDLADPDAVRNAYRRNVQVHHPDRGGAHDDMVALNRRYAELKGFKFGTGIRRKSLYGSKIQLDDRYYFNMPWIGCSPASPLEADLRISIVLFERHIDDYEFRKAHDLLFGKLKPDLDRQEKAGAGRKRPGLTEHFKIDVFERSYDLLKALHAIDARDLIPELEAYANALLTRTSRPGATADERDKHARKYRELLLELGSNVPVRLNPSHPGQREKLKRLLAHGGA